MQNNKFLKVTWLALVLLISNYAAKASATDTLKLGQRVIGFNLHNVVEGEKSQVSLEDYQNKKGVIVVFMTNGCYHCILYRERIKAFQKDYAAKGYQLITINPSNPTYAKEETTEEMIKNAKKEKYDFPIELIYNDPKLFQIKSIDYAYSLVDTEYIFHMEEDWLFLKPNFIENSIEILEQDDNIVQVWLRGLDDPTLKHPYSPDIYECNGIQLVQNQYSIPWGGISFNPGLNRLSDWKSFPNGYDGCTRLTPPEQSGGVTLECDISYENILRGKITMRFLESYIEHIGWDRHIVEGINGK